MDSFGHRAQLMFVLDKAVARAEKEQRDSELGQPGLFLDSLVPLEGRETQTDKLPDIPHWDEHQRLAAEKEILGFFITGHPLEKYSDKLLGLSALAVAEVLTMKASTGKDETITTAGIIANVRVLKSRKGDFYAQATLEDSSGSIDMIVFPEAYRRLQEKVKLEVPVLVKAGVRVEEGSNPKITAAEITPLEDARVPLPRSLRIRIPLEEATQGTVDALHLLFTERRGEARVLFDVERAGDFMVVMEAEGYNVHPDRNFIARVEQLCGRGSVRIID
jgi:DNA polymerase-3 subunit alpha